ncbi:MAG: hypothetical protein JSS99_07100 [Actinobacteria bacterium]|nr:hypothetical protein [Actinomycetota bacterium]
MTGSRRVLLLALPLLAAAPALSACGGGAGSSGGAASSPPPPAHVHRLLRGGGAGAPPPPARRRIAAAVERVCRSVAMPPLGSHGPGHAALRAAQLRREIAWLTGLRAQLGRMPVARADRLRWSDYRRAVANQLVLDAIVVRGLLSGDDALGVDAGEHQNLANRATRDALAAALHAPCLATFTS